MPLKTINSGSISNPHPETIAPERRIDEIEVLRAIAIIMVLVEHIQLNLFFWHSGIQDFGEAYWRGGAGVDLFFAISGFVIARGLLPRLELCQNGTAWFAATLTFLLRRFWRLQPAAWLWIAIPLVLSIVFNRSGAFQTLQANLPSALTAFFAVNNLRTAQIIFVSSTGITFPYWSLSLEEQFYLVLPVLAWIFRRRLPYLLMAVVAFQFFVPPTFIFGMTRCGAIAAGVLLAIWSNRPEYALAEPRFLGGSFWIRLIVVSACVMFLGTLLSNLPLPLYAVPRGLVAVIAAFLVYAASFDRGYIMRAGLLRRGLVWIGARSYGIYLTHIPAYALTRELYFRFRPPVFNVTTQLAAHYILAGFALTFLFAALNYRFVEMPCRRYGKSLRITPYTPPA